MRATPLLLFLAASLGTSIVASPVAAQERQISVRASIGSPAGQASISKRSVERWSETLGLSADQREALLGLHAGYLAAYEEARREFMEVQEEVSRAARETQDFAVFGEKMPAAQKRFADKSRAAEAALMSDARMLLTPDQEPLWPRVERMRRREQASRLSTVSGDSIDVTEVVAGLKVPIDPALAEALEQYEIEADKAIQTQLKLAETARGIEPGKPINVEEFQAQMDAAREAALKRKEVNQRHVRKVEPMLPEDSRAAFRDAVKQQSFPQVYRQSTVSRWLEAAAKLPDLTADQREELDRLNAGYQRDLKPANDAWAAAIEKGEAEPGGGGALAGPGGTMMVTMGEESSELASARKARRELDERVRERIRSLLTAEQREQLPKGEDEAVPGRQMMIRSR